MQESSKLFKNEKNKMKTIKKKKTNEKVIDKILSLFFRTPTLVDLTVPISHLVDLRSLINSRQERELIGSSLWIIFSWTR